jgi:hypothetical protein
VERLCGARRQRRGSFGHQTRTDTEGAEQEKEWPNHPAKLETGHGGPPEKRIKLYDESECSRILQESYNRKLTADEMVAIQQRFRKDCTPQFKVSLRYLKDAFEFQRATYQNSGPTTT